jgi:hypothetical protein
MYRCTASGHSGNLFQAYFDEEDEDEDVQRALNLLNDKAKIIKAELYDFFFEAGISVYLFIRTTIQLCIYTDLPIYIGLFVILPMYSIYCAESKLILTL